MQTNCFICAAIFHLAVKWISKPLLINETKIHKTAVFKIESNYMKLK